MALLSLPTELVENIAAHLDIHSVRSFRLTNSSLSQQSLHGFKQRFFRKRTVEWRIDSLQQLENVTSHPNFEGCMEDLVVDATPRFAIRRWELEGDMIRAQRDPEKHSDLKSRLLRVKEEAEDAARYWDETRQDRKTLTSVFARLQTLPSITFAYTPMNKNFTIHGRRYCVHSQNEISRPFVSTMAALATSRLTVQSIGIDHERRYGAISIGRLETISPILAGFDDAFLKLDSLKLHLRDWRHPDEGFEMPPGRAPFIVRFLSKSRNIRTLELSCYSSLEKDILPAMAKHCTFSRMETCKLDLFRIRAVDHLFNFLEPSKSSLRSLSLSYILLEDEHSGWDQVLRRIASDLTLGKVEFKCLFMRLRTWIGFDNSTRESLLLEGPDVTKQLEKQAANLVAESQGLAWHLATQVYPGMRWL